jgi:RimJ/RimL family protein N-acetyltransferase
MDSMSVSELKIISTGLRGSRVMLEPLAEVHGGALWQAAQAAEIWRWTSHIADSRKDFDAWVESSLSASRDQGRQTFVTVDLDSGGVVGSTSYHHFRPQDGVIEIGSTWLNPRVWGSGVNAEAKLLLLEHAFETLGCVRVEFKTDVRNARSRAALAALPAQFEGVLRKQINIPGIGVRDSAFFSVIDDEWPKVRENLLARLGRS